LLASPFDPFKNYRKIEKVEARTCIMHGTQGFSATMARPVPSNPDVNREKEELLSVYLMLN